MERWGLYLRPLWRVDIGRNATSIWQKCGGCVKYSCTLWGYTLLIPRREDAFGRFLVILRAVNIIINSSRITL